MDLICDFTNTYPAHHPAGPAPAPGEEREMRRLDFSALPGTDLYCDDAAAEEILTRLSQFGPWGIHLIDSGNTHYMTRLFTSLLSEPYELALFDHHPDLQPPAFGGLLSCGGWALDVLEKDPNIRKLLLIGPPEQAYAELPREIREDARICFVSQEKVLRGEAVLSTAGGLCGEDPAGEALPLYVSVDKDLLSTKEVLTNWDQGEVSMKCLLELLKAVCRGRRLLGADICGALPRSGARNVGKQNAPQGADAEALALRSDLELIRFFRRFLPE